jgi:hypothetical protein
MLYAVLIYGSEAIVEGWSAPERGEVMDRHARVREGLLQQGRLGPVVRLAPTTSATTLRAGRRPVVLDGPFAETKEQLLGFYTVQCASLEEALDVARGLAFDSGVFEVRPVTTFIAAGTAGECN